VIDKSAEVNAYLSLNKAGLITRQQISKELGYGDWFETEQELVEEQDAIKRDHLIVEMGTPGAVTTQDQQQDNTEQK
jgi:hypothetical protein